MANEFPERRAPTLEQRLVSFGQPLLIAGLIAVITLLWNMSSSLTKLSAEQAQSIIHIRDVAIEVKEVSTEVQRLSRESVTRGDLQTLEQRLRHIEQEESGSARKERGR